VAFSADAQQFRNGVSADRLSDCESSGRREKARAVIVDAHGLDPPVADGDDDEVLPRAGRCVGDRDLNRQDADSVVMMMMHETSFPFRRS
jgi:hypothetical protein